MHGIQIYSNIYLKRIFSKTSFEVRISDPLVFVQSKHRNPRDREILLL